MLQTESAKQLVPLNSALHCTMTEMLYMRGAIVDGPMPDELDVLDPGTDPISTAASPPVIPAPLVPQDSLLKPENSNSDPIPAPAPPA